MVTSFNSYELIVYLFTYLTVYNTTLIFFFWTFMNFTIIQYKTLYFFNTLKFNFFQSTIFTSCIFSMAGVPPFLGFFSKIFILIIISSTYFFIFYLFFFILLFLGLYFYVQNIRFLLSSKFSNSTLQFDFQLNQFTTYYVFSIFFGFLIFFGFFFLDDIVFFFFWLFS